MPAPNHTTRSRVRPKQREERERERKLLLIQRKLIVLLDDGLVCRPTTLATRSKSTIALTRNFFQDSNKVNTTGSAGPDSIKEEAADAAEEVATDPATAGEAEEEERTSSRATPRQPTLRHRQPKNRNLQKATTQPIRLLRRPQPTILGKSNQLYQATT